MASFSSSDEVPLPIAMEVQSMALSKSELEVIQWLQSIGFERYQQKFVAADIFSLEVVCEIDSLQDLEELGIPKFSGKLLMKRIEELKENRFTAPPPEGSAGARMEDDYAHNDVTLFMQEFMAIIGKEGEDDDWFNYALHRYYMENREDIDQSLMEVSKVHCRGCGTCNTLESREVELGCGECLQKKKEQKKKENLLMWPRGQSLDAQ